MMLSEERVKMQKERIEKACSHFGSLDEAKKLADERYHDDNLEKADPGKKITTIWKLGDDYVAVELYQREAALEGGYEEVYDPADPDGTILRAEKEQGRKDGSSEPATDLFGNTIR